MVSSVLYISEDGITNICRDMLLNSAPYTTTLETCHSKATSNNITIVTTKLSFHLHYKYPYVTDPIATHLQNTKDHEPNLHSTRDATWFLDMRGDSNRIEELSCTPYPLQEE